MKVVILFCESADERFFTNEELLQRWENVKCVPGVDEVVIEKTGDTSFASYDRLFSDADAVLNAWLTVDNMRHELFDRHPALKYLSTYSHGFEDFDRDYAREKGVTITNTVYGDTTIAEHAMALLFEICRGVGSNQRYMMEKFRQKETHFWATAATRQIELYGKTIGIIGVGNIGFHMAKI